MQIFTDASKATAKHLFEMALSVFALNSFQSAKYNFEHFIGEASEYKLKSFYYTLNESKINLQDWMKYLVAAALSIYSSDTQQPVVLAIDDTLIEKFGEKFEHRSKLFEHAAHNGSNYLNGHCFVSLLLYIPVKDSSGCRCLSCGLQNVDEGTEQTGNSGRAGPSCDDISGHTTSGDSVL